MVAMATKQHFKHCRTWSQLKAQQPLLLNSTISTTSWNYIFLEQDGFEVVIWCVCSGSVLVLAATLLWRNSPEPWPNPWPANVFSQDCLPRINVACKIGNVTVPVFRHCQYSCFDVLYRISHLLYKSVRQYCVWQSSVRLFIFRHWAR